MSPAANSRRMDLSMSRTGVPDMTSLATRFRIGAVMSTGEVWALFPRGFWLTTT
ncbi:MAG: hypothetical protein BWY99_02261 [Synergistetes bacterium ADurb.BinA166]|nr:MAG: hypothetical protein BWY99_02261 [Synergistetes bacterium ADurb.BinA166]